MGGPRGPDKYRFPLAIKERFVEDIIGLFHHYHHNGDEHEVHHCVHSGIKIVHCGCKTKNGSVQHATETNELDCMVHLPDITGIPIMELFLSEKCPKLGWYHLGTLATKVKRVRYLCRAVG